MYILIDGILNETIKKPTSVLQPMKYEVLSEALKDARFLVQTEKNRKIIVAKEVFAIGRAPVVLIEEKCS